MARGNKLTLRESTIIASFIVLLYIFIGSIIGFFTEARTNTGYTVHYTFHNFSTVEEVCEWNILISNITCYQTTLHYTSPGYEILDVNVSRQFIGKPPSPEYKPDNLEVSRCWNYHKEAIVSSCEYTHLLSYYTTLISIILSGIGLVGILCGIGIHEYVQKISAERAARRYEVMADCE